MRLQTFVRKMERLLSLHPDAIVEVTDNRGEWDSVDDWVVKEDEPGVYDSQTFKRRTATVVRIYA